MMRRVFVMTVVCVLGASAFIGLSAQSLPLYQLTEDLRIASDESSRERALTRISALTVLADGTIISFHGGRITWDQGTVSIGGSGGTKTEHLLRMFTSAGRFVRVIGREGQGPGEFVGLGQGGVVGDNIWTSDYSSGRTTVFSRDGSPLKIALRPSGTEGRTIALLSGDRRLVSYRFTTRGPSDPTGRESDSVVFGIEDSTGRRLIRVALDPTGKHKSMSGRAGAIPWRSSQLLAGRVLAAYAEGGELAVVASDAEAWGGRPGQVRLQLIGRDNIVTQQVVQFQPQAVPRNYLEERAARFSTNPAEAAQVLAIFRREFYLPDFYPVLQSLKVGRDGSVWINPMYEPGMWTVVVNGQPQFRVRVETGITVHAVTRTQMWAVREDANGVPMVIRYTVGMR